MPTSVLALVLIAGLMPTAVVAQVTQVPRDTPPPAIQIARRVRELRALVESGGATKDTYIELAHLDILLNHLDDAVAALQNAAQLEWSAPEVQHLLATIAWQHANQDVTDPAGRLLFIREGLRLEDRALALKPDYVDAMIYKNILLRLQANLSSDSVEKARLIADADALRSRVLELQAPIPPDDAPASFSGFGESFDETSDRLSPVRVGGNIPQPAKTHNARPTYPTDARTQHVQGVVIIQALVDPSGSVANARILRSIPGLDEAALSAVSRWHFAPTVVDGAAIAVLMTVTVNFALEKDR